MTRLPTAALRAAATKPRLDAAPEERDERGSERISEQVATGGSKQMGQAAGEDRSGRKDGQAHSAFDQVGAKRGGGQARREQDPSSRTAKVCRVSGTGVK